MKGLFKQMFGGKSSQNNQEINRLYELYKTPFVLFALKYYRIGEETAKDIYQESFTALCQNVREGKYKESKVSLKTYLFEIGKHRICNYLNRNQIEYTDIQSLSSEWMEQHYDTGEWTEAQEIVSQLIHEADGTCNKVLKMYYWERLKMEEIARIMDYKTEQIARNKKSSCLRRMKFELKKRLRAAGIQWTDKK